MVKAQLKYVRKNYAILTTLYFIFAKAGFSESYNGTAPIFNTKKYIKLNKARHPLLDPTKVVPTTLELGGEYDMLVITGPNTGGKTLTILSVLLLIPFVGLSQPFMTAFTTDQPTIEAGIMILRTWAICIPFLGVQFTMMSTLQVFGQATRAMIVNIGRQSIFFFPFLYLFNSFGNLTGLFMTNPVSDIVTTIVAVLLVISPLRKLLKAAKEVA